VTRTSSGIRSLRVSPGDFPTRILLSGAHWPIAAPLPSNIVVRIGGGPGEGFFLIVAGTPGLLIWLTGVILGLLSGAAERIGRDAQPPPRVRAAPAYRQWSETGSAGVIDSGDLNNGNSAAVADGGF
jgi:hypothetical protein